MKLTRNQFGLSLIEISIALALTGGLALTIAKMMENSSQNAKQIEAKTENINLKGIIQNILSNNIACSNTFSALITQANLTTLNTNPLASINVPSIKDKTNTLVYSISSTNIRPLFITSISLTNFKAAAGTGDLYIQSNFKRSASITQVVKPIRIPLNFNIDNSVPTTPILIACSTMAVGSGEWQLAGNAGTVDGVDYLGTSDSNPLNFRVNAQPSGRIDTTDAAFFGYKAGGLSTTGTFNTGVGFKALQTVTTTGDNTAVGYLTLSALGNNGTWGNTAIGSNALSILNTGGNNTAIGRNAQATSTTGTYNTCVGALCMNNLTTGSQNIAIGVTALWGNNLNKLTGSNNIGIGYNAGSMISTGGQNLLIGNSAGTAITTGSNNIVLGNDAAPSLITENNRLYIDSTSASNPLIGGNFGTREVYLDGKVGIGTTTPGTPDHVGTATANIVKLHVKGGSTILDQRAWQDVTLSSSASSGTGSWMKCRVDSVGNVHLKGYIDKIATASSSSQTTLGTLPLDCRPRSALDGGVSGASAPLGTGIGHDKATGARRCFHISGIPGDAYWDGRMQPTACDSTQGTAWGGSAFDQTWWQNAQTIYIGEIIFSKLQ